MVSRICVQNVPQATRAHFCSHFVVLHAATLSGCCLARSQPAHAREMPMLFKTNMTWKSESWCWCHAVELFLAEKLTILTGHPVYAGEVSICLPEYFHSGSINRNASCPCGLDCLSRGSSMHSDICFAICSFLGLSIVSNNEKKTCDLVPQN